MTLKKIRKAVFPVAGLGTRLLPATKVMPKEMLTLVDKPLIQHAVEEAQEAGIEEFIFVTGRHKEMLEEHFDFQPELEETLEKRGKHDLLAKIKSCGLPAGSLSLTRQPKALGLGHAIWCARALVGDEPFAVMLPDDVFMPESKHAGCLSQLVENYNKLGGNICAVADVPRTETSRYGILDISDDHGTYVAARGMVEKPKPEDAPSTTAIMGRYILQPSVFKHLSVFETGAGGEIQLTDAMAKLIGTEAFHGVRFNGTRYDCGTKLGFIETNIAFAMRDPEIADAVQEILIKQGRLAEQLRSEAA